MKHHLILTLILATASSLAAQSPMVKQLTEQLAQQGSRLAEMETLRMTYDNPQQHPASAHELRVRLDGGIQVVTECHTEDDVYTQKDYFLNESKVYALRVSQQIPCLDGKTKRVAESLILFDKGTPLLRTTRSARVPVADTNPKLSKVSEHEMPLPAGLDGRGDRLTAHAFDIARRFRTGVGKHVFGNWDEWLLKDAPPAGSSEKPLRNADWLPPPDVLALPIPLSESPDGLFAIGWGYAEGPVDWPKLATDGAHPDFGEIYFTTKLVEGGLNPPLSDDSNFLLNAQNGKQLGNLGAYHPGERQRFNHDELLVNWSPSSTCFIVRETAKWETAAAGIGWIKDGRCAGTFEILAPLEAAAIAAVLKSKDPAAKRLRSKDEGEGFAFSVYNLLLEDDGRIEARVVGQIPKDDRPGGIYEAIVEGVLTPGTGESDAVLKTSKVKVIPQKPQE